MVFICLIALDIFSHWFQMYQALLAGAATHKVSGWVWAVLKQPRAHARAGCTHFVLSPPPSGRAQPQRARAPVLQQPRVHGLLLHLL